jgi:hypothetical protein
MSTLIPKFDLKDGGSIPAGAVNRPINKKLAETISVKDFGAVGDGVTNDTVAIQNAINASANQTLLFDGVFLISASLDINSPMKIQFSGGAGILGPSSYLKKSGTPFGDALIIYPGGIGTIIEGGGVVGLAGNTGNGIRVYANSVTLRNVVVTGCGGSGFRIGPDTVMVGTNFNDFTLSSCKAYDNGEHGLYIHDPNTASNTNAGVVTCFSALNNGGDGIRVENAYWNTFVGCTYEDNTGYGLNILSTAQFNTFIGGDIEGNTAGAISNSGLGTSFIGISALTYISQLTDLQISNQFRVTNQYINTNGSTATPTYTNSAEWFSAGATGTNYAGTFYSGSDSTNTFIGFLPTSVAGQSDTVGWVTINGGVVTKRIMVSGNGVYLPYLSGNPIEVGAADSGGTGYRMLRVAN